MPAAAPPKPAPPATAQRAQRAAFWAVLLAIPVLFFVLLEVGLRVGGYGEDTSLFAEVETAGVSYYVVNPNVVRRYFGDPDFGTYVSRDRFRVQKEPGTYRVFALGASTTVGFPYLFHGSFSSLLNDRLVTQFPERRVEMVNVGITAVNSYTVADLTKELMRYEPDLLLVYSGHNEFYGALGAGSSETISGRRGMVRAYLALQRYKTVQLLRDGIVAMARAPAVDPDSRDAQLMELMAREREIRHDSRLFHQVRRAYEANLADVVQTAQRNGVPVILSTLASNLREQPPFVSVHSEGLSAEERARWQQLYDQARVTAENGDCGQALRILGDVLALDGGRADAHFLRAQCLEQMGDYAAAHQAYIAARDFDGLRFRASTEFNDVVRELAARAGVPAVDMEAAFAAASPNGLVGSELMTEHVHPTFDGYLVMARAFAEALARHGLFASDDEWASTPAPEEDFLRRFAGLTEFDHEVARLRIAQLTSRWPFQTDPQPFEFQPETLAQRFAWEYLSGRVGWGVARNELSRAYAQGGEDERSAEELWALAKVTSYDPHYAVTAADLHARSGRFDRAAEMYAFAQAIRFEPLTEAKLGTALLESGDIAAAITHLQRATTMRTGRPMTPQQRAQVHLVLARAHAQRGDQAAAQEQLALAQRLASSPPAQPPPSNSGGRTG